MPSEAQKNCEKIHCRILCHPAGRSVVQKHNWGRLHAPKKRTAQIQAMQTKLMLTNLQDFVSKKSSNQKHEDRGADHGYNSVSLHNPFLCPVIWIRLRRSRAQNHGIIYQILWYHWRETCADIHHQDYGGMMGKSTRMGMLTHASNKCFFYQFTCMISTMLEKKVSLKPCGNK